MVFILRGHQLYLVSVDITSDNCTIPYHIECIHARWGFGFVVKQIIEKHYAYVPNLPEFDPASTKSSDEITSANLNQDFIPWICYFRFCLKHLNETSISGVISVCVDEITPKWNGYFLVCKYNIPGAPLAMVWLKLGHGVPNTFTQNTYKFEWSARGPPVTDTRAPMSVYM